MERPQSTTNGSAMTQNAKMLVYLNNRLIVTETNLAWAVPYWSSRGQQVKGIKWLIA